MIEQYQLRMYHHLYEIQILQQNLNNEWILNIIRNTIFDDEENRKCVDLYCYDDQNDEFHGIEYIKCLNIDGIVDGENIKMYDSNYNINVNDGIQYIANIKIDDLECNNNDNDGIHDIDKYKKW